MIPMKRLAKLVNGYGEAHRVKRYSSASPAPFDEELRQTAKNYLKTSTSWTWSSQGYSQGVHTPEE